MEKVRKIDEEIEALRTKMYKLYFEKPNSRELLETSQQLDQTLNKFRKLKNKTVK